MPYNEKRKKSHDLWVEKNRDKIKAYFKNYAQTRDKTYFKKYYIRNKDKYVFNREWTRLCKIDIF
jgi:hypothetical protein